MHELLHAFAHNYPVFSQLILEEHASLLTYNLLPCVYSTLAVYPCLHSMFLNLP